MSQIVESLLDSNIPTRVPNDPRQMNLPHTLQP